MRVRLLIDVMWPENRITELGEHAAAQEEVQLTAPAKFRASGRLMGAQPVEGNSTLAEPERKP